MAGANALDPKDHNKLKRQLRGIAKELGIPYGEKGLAAVGIGFPLVAIISIKIFGLVTSLFYAVPIGIILAIVYAESDFAQQVDKDD